MIDELQKSVHEGNAYDNVKASPTFEDDINVILLVSRPVSNFLYIETANLKSIQLNMHSHDFWK